MLTVWRTQNRIGPLRRERFDADWRGQTARALRDEFRDPRWSPEVDVDVVVDGVFVPAARLDEPVADGADVHVVPSWGFPALAPVGPTLGGFLAGLAYNVIALAVVAGVSYGIQRALAQRPPPVRRGDEVSPTFAWDGIATSFAPGLPIPVILGEHRVGGQVVYSAIREDALTAGTLRRVLGEQLQIQVALGFGTVYRIGDVDAGACGEVDDLGGGPDPFQIRTPRPLPSGLRINGNEVDANERSVVAHLRTGTSQQGPMRSGFDDASTTYDVDTELRNGSPVTYQTTGTTVDVAQLLVRFPTGLYRISGNDLLAFPVHLRWRFREVGTTAWSQWVDWRIEPIVPVRNQVSESVQVVFGSRGQWEIELDRVTPDDNLNKVDTQTFSVSTLAAVTERTRTTLAYPWVAMLGLEIASTERFSGTFNNVTIPVKGVLVRRSVAQSVGAYEWLNGSAESGRNPAWVLLEVLTNPIWGGARLGLSLSNIDLESFEAWADYCDESVTGPDGPEPRHQCDLVVDQQRSFWEWVLTICATGRAVPLLYGNTLKVVYDAPRPRVQLFTDASMSDQVLRYIVNPDRPTVLDVSFMNRARDWERDSKPVEDNEALIDPTSIDRRSIVRETLELAGVTRESQARREAIYVHRENALRTEELEFTVPVVALDAEVWDRVAIQAEFPRWWTTAASPPTVVSPATYGWRTSRAGNTTTDIYLDHDVTLDGAKSYTVLLRQNDGTLALRSVVASTSGTFAADTAIPLTQPCSYEQGSELAFGELEKTVKDFQITSIRPISGAGELQFRVRAVTYDPAIYDIPAEEESPQGEGYPEDVQPAPQGLTIANPVPSVRHVTAVLVAPRLVRVGWDAPAGHARAAFRLYARRYDRFDVALENPTDWWLLGQTDERMLEFPHAEMGVTYDFAVTVRDRNGAWSSPFAATSVRYTAEEFPNVTPPDVERYEEIQREHGFELHLPEIHSTDVMYTEVRRGTVWVGGEVVARTRESRIVVEDARYGSEHYIVRARHRHGLYSKRALEFDHDGLVPVGWALENELVDLDTSAQGTATGMTFDAATMSLVLDAGLYHGEYLSPVLYPAGSYVAREGGGILLREGGGGILREASDELSEAKRWWSCRVGLRVEDLAHTAAAATYGGNSGEALWRTPLARDPSPLHPGVDFDVLTLGASTPTLESTMRSGGIGSGLGENQRMRVYARFLDEGGMWGDWQLWRTGARSAAGAQWKLVVDRASLDLDLRVAYLGLAVAVEGLEV